MSALQFYSLVRHFPIRHTEAGDAITTFPHQDCFQMALTLFQCWNNNVVEIRATTLTTQPNLFNHDTFVRCEDSRNSTNLTYINPNSNNVVFVTFNHHLTRWVFGLVQRDYWNNKAINILCFPCVNVV